MDPGSPAEAGGLKVSDRIIEVNGANVVNESHAQIVERIKAVPNETRLLVLDPEADAYYQQRNILVSGTQSNVLYVKTPPVRPGSGSYSSDEEGGENNHVEMRRRYNRSQVSARSRQFGDFFLRSAALSECNSRCRASFSAPDTHVRPFISENLATAGVATVASLSLSISPSSPSPFA